MPHFEKAQIHGDIKGGTFYDVKGDAHVQVSTGGSLSGFDILHRNVAESAFHNSNARFPPPKCHPDTRKAVIKAIMAWLSNGTEDNDIDKGEGDSGGEGSSGKESDSGEDGHSGGNGNSEEDGDSGDGGIEDDCDSEDGSNNGEESSGDEAYSGEDGDSGDDGYRREQKKPILWLHAPAGAGKSAIAQSVAELCCAATPSSLAASFFFSRSIAERNTGKKLAATLAYQIAVSTPAVRPFIEDAVKLDPSIFSRSLEVQFANLIARPLVQAAAADGPSPTWPTLILLDGLDECIGQGIGNMDGEHKQCAIIEAIYTTLTRFDISLQFLIASRPEPHIHNMFKRPDIFSISRYLKLDDSFDPDQDIETFLRAEFSRICTYHSSMVSVVEWPSEGDISCLIDNSSQQFIYAATVIKFVSDPRRNPVQRLDMVLRTPNEALPSPFTSLDTLYRQVLDAAQFENTDVILSIFNLVNHSSPSLTLTHIAGFVALSVQDVNLLLYDLHSIIDVSFDSKVKFFHASFSDFLYDQSRAGRYYLDLIDSGAHIVQLFLQVLNERCECIHQLGCHHTYAQRYGMNLLPFARPSPALLNSLDRFSLKLSKDLDANSYDVYSITNWLYTIATVMRWLQPHRLPDSRAPNSVPKIFLNFVDLFDKTVRKLLDNKSSLPDVLIVMSVLTLPFWHERIYTRNHTGHLMDLIYSPENHPASRIPAILESESLIINAFNPYHRIFGSLEEYFTDPSRSAEYFLGDTDAYLAMRSLASSIQRPKTLIENHHLLLFLQESITYKEHCSISVHHLSRASISSPFLVDFPKPVDPALGAEQDEDLTKAVARFLLDNSKAYELLQEQTTKKTSCFDVLWIFSASIRKFLS